MEYQFFDESGLLLGSSDFQIDSTALSPTSDYLFNAFGIRAERFIYATPGSELDLYIDDVTYTVSASEPLWADRAVVANYVRNFGRTAGRDFCSGNYVAGLDTTVGLRDLVALQARMHGPNTLEVTSVVPEPNSLSLGLMAGACLAVWVRRLRRLRAHDEAISPIS
jgi:hypothetical protein